MFIVGYFAAVFIGIALGLIGGGGSILTVPVLVYIFGVSPIIATTYSLFVVGITSAVGSTSYIKKKQVSIPTLWAFGIPSVIAVVLTKTFLLPAIPNHLLQLGNFKLTKNIFIMLLFAILMLMAAVKMIRPVRISDSFVSTQGNKHYLFTIVQGLIVGMVTGLIGAGGGFLIIPALVNWLHLPIKKAIGTSLVIIAINSLIGFFVHFTQVYVDWMLLLSITCIAIVGILLGAYWSTKINSKMLKPAFGWFVLVMGIYILLKELM
jgi:uncharacterized membrane protein YfcA